MKTKKRKHIMRGKGDTTIQMGIDLGFNTTGELSHFSIDLDFDQYEIDDLDFKGETDNEKY